ncbi:nucleoside hydrolase [Lysobacter sp. SG-8]|uniref:Nucleoside hydrolase n=1 Tax=Marilutibacter penaei TaxID=2759900 RepID=A0A7W3YEK8_9GAMM|nr:nucleoside hydrolase [Lysobacter penaei]MBB1088306.1 nucleoside hydrolase [Lysobacter penaei]
MTHPIPLFIDTDPGVDDALAVLMALSDPDHRVVGLGIAAGNVGLAHTVRNAMKLCEVAGADVPVFPGCPTPLLHPAPDAADVHGADGFGDAGLSPPVRHAETEHAALALIRLSHAHAGRLLLVALGPLTNIALAVRLDPTLPSRIARVVVMGGAVTGQGNITPSAEFNIHFDPEAAHIVFEAFPDIDLADWEATVAHSLAHDDVVEWLAAEGPRARFYDAISHQTRMWSLDRRGDRWFCADALAMAWALQPSGARRVECRPLAVALEGRHSRGATVVDWRRQTGRPDNARLLMAYDQDLFEKQVRDALAGAVPA